MVNFLGELTDLVSSVSTVVKEVSQEVVNDVKKSATTAATTTNNKENNTHKNNNNSKRNSHHQHSSSANTTTTTTTTSHGGRPTKRRNTTHSSSSGGSGSRSIPTSLDMHYILDNLLVMPQPTVDTRTAKRYFDILEQQQQQRLSHDIQGGGASTCRDEDGTSTTRTAGMDTGNPQEKEQQQQQETPPLPTLFPDDSEQHQSQQHRNDVTVLADFLLRQNYSSIHQKVQSQAPTTNNTNFKVFNVSDTPAEDTIVRALQGQVVQCPWKSPAAPRTCSETPNMNAMLDTVYALHAFLSQPPPQQPPPPPRHEENNHTNHYNTTQLEHSYW